MGSDEEEIYKTLRNSGVTTLWSLCWSWTYPHAECYQRFKSSSVSFLVITEHRIWRVDTARLTGRYVELNDSTLLLLSQSNSWLTWLQSHRYKRVSINFLSWLFNPMPCTFLTGQTEFTEKSDGISHFYLSLLGQELLVRLATHRRILTHISIQKK